jgi:hypothetical protein
VGKLPAGSEPLLAIVRPDGISVLGADSDGYVAGTLQDQDTLDLCYTQTRGATAVGCTVFSRQRAP